MLQVSVDNIESYKKDFEKLFGENFINQTDKNTLNHPFFEYWNSYIEDIKKIKESKQLYCSVNTSFILELLSNLMDLKEKCDSTRLVKSLLQRNMFYSTVFEIQIAALYSHIYNIEVIQETQNKTPDFKIDLKNGPIVYLECKSLQDVEIENNHEYKRIIESLQKYCKKKHKSNQIIIRTNGNFSKKNTEDSLLKIKDLINKNNFGYFNFEDLNIEVNIEKISDWDTPIYGNMHIMHHSKQSSFEIISQTQVLPTGIIRNKNVIVVEIEAKPILGFEKRIERELAKAGKQIPIGKFGIVHMQLPIHAGLDFEKYINENYDNLKYILLKKTKRVKALVLSNPLHNIRDYNPISRNVQYYVIPNMGIEQDSIFNFRYPFTSYLPNNIPDFTLPNENTEVQLGNIGYTPAVDWNTLPVGTIQVNMVSISGRTQFKIWKSYDGTITFDIIINGMRMCVKSKEDPFIINEKNSIDIVIKNKNIDVYVNRKKLNIRKFI